MADSSRYAGSRCGYKFAKTLDYQTWGDYPDFFTLLFLSESHRFYSILLRINCDSYLQQLTTGLEKAFAPLNRIFTKSSHKSRLSGLSWCRPPVGQKASHGIVVSKGYKDHRISGQPNNIPDGRAELGGFQEFGHRIVGKI